ncbi:hypothetical protein E4T50_14843 [Aureobasidium sp. EXF-12298]|nr:hypothetical protein E4T50_14843 [Aureobasidium sp. EXF-12298]KAI4754079.1 hypothetical protein E4T51_12806 [Aureobasidium sp. EXF-12344]KAI4769531.1 hypothetical protein E4T52_15432 [Aureobasidium sp. EXF-3400]
MPRAKSVKPEAAPKPEPDLQQVTIDKGEFTRTRDALITSWVALDNALKNTITAYIDHSNAWLGGTVDLDPSMIDLGKFLQTGELVTIGGGPPAAPEKKQRKRVERDPNQPKRPLTAYLLWLGENREKIHSELGPEQKRGEISSEGTKRWNALPEEVKQKYKDAYVASRDLYNKELAEFKANSASAAAAAASPDADEDEEPAQAAAAVESDDSDDGSTSEEEEKEPTPPPVKTPKSAVKGGRGKKAAPPASSPPLPTSSPVKKGAFTAVNGSNKRKSKTTDAEAVAEEPKKKRGRKAKEEDVPASTPAEVPASAKKEKKEKKKGRKSVGGDA